MRALIIFALAAVLPVLQLSCGGRDSAPGSSHRIFDDTKPSGLKVLLVGIDGATFDIIEPMIAEGRLPEFKRLMDSGAHARFMSQEPMVSPALWTTIATGRSRRDHGILGFVSRREGEKEKPVLISSNDRNTAALWNIVSPFKLTVGSVGYWATWPAEPVRGFIVSDRVAHSRMEFWTDAAETGHMAFPPSLFEGVKHLIVEPTEPPMAEIDALVELSAEERREMLAVKRPVFAHWLSVFKYGYCAQRTYENIALHMLDRKQPDLGIIFLIAIDPVCHTFWHFYRPEEFGDAVDEAAASRLGVVIPAMYEHTDRYIGELLSRVDPSTVVIMVSDHGFRGTGQVPRKTKVVDYRQMGINRVERLSQAVKVGMSGWHQIEGIFIASGGPIIPGAAPLMPPKLSDVAPTVLALMGLPVARDMDGRVLKEIMDPAFLDRHPVTYVDSYEKLIDRSRLSAEAGASEEEQLEYLRSLGYIQ